MKNPDEVNRARWFLTLLFAVATAVWLASAAIYMKSCSELPGCENAIVEEFPEGHGK